MLVLACFLAVVVFKPFVSILSSFGFDTDSVALRDMLYLESLAPFLQIKWPPRHTKACRTFFHEVFAELTGCKIWWTAKKRRSERKKESPLCRTMLLNWSGVPSGTWGAACPILVHTDFLLFGCLLREDSEDSRQPKRGQPFWFSGPGRASVGENANLTGRYWGDLAEASF